MPCWATLTKQGWNRSAREAEHINQDDPQQMARMMRKFTEKTGIDFGDNMAEALRHLD